MKIESKRGKRFTTPRLIVIICLILAIVLASSLSYLVSAAAWPDCNWNCNAGDFTVNQIFLGDDTGAPLSPCTPGSNVTAEVWVEFDNGTGTNRYNFWMDAQFLVNGVLEDSILTCVADTLPSGMTNASVYGPFQYECGDSVQFNLMVISWITTGPASCVEPTKCASRGSQCYGTINWSVEAPLDVDFNHNSPQCYGTNISFWDATKGGIKPYTAWSWDFGDGIGSSTTQNTSYQYTSAGSYNVTFTVTDSDSPPVTSNITKAVTVNPNPTATASNDGPYCEGDSISLTGGPGGMATYNWSGPDSYSSSSQSPTIPSATLAMNGTYTLNV
ncbi:PKD repeat-containing protein, partial [Candidatus Methanophagaceae archaeon]